MTDRQKIEELLDKAGLYMMKEYGLDVLHALEKMMCSPITQDIFEGKRGIDDLTPEKLGDYYLDIPCIND